ncbi:MAG: hypothetical protein AAGH15_01335, partial [Myxococcota bacterium]
TVDRQVVYGVFASYGIARPAEITLTFEVQNVGDARVFDFFGVQRPGRSYFLKLSGELEAR